MKDVGMDKEEQHLQMEIVMMDNIPSINVMERGSMPGATDVFIPVVSSLIVERDMVFTPGKFLSR